MRRWLPELQDLVATASGFPALGSPNCEVKGLTTEIAKPPADFASEWSADGLERRTRRRLPLALPARITVHAGLDRASRANRTVVGHTRNVSSRGAYLTSSEAFAPGQVLFVALNVPADLGRTPAVEIRCQATVVRVDAAPPGSLVHGVAVRFRRAGIPKDSSRERISSPRIARMAPL